MKTFIAIVVSCLLVLAAADGHAAPAPPAKDDHGHGHGGSAAKAAAPAAPTPPACTQDCPFMPVNPLVGQRSGFAAYKYEGGGPNMPENWGKLDCKNPPYNIFAGCSYCTNECGGKVQSPVDVKPSMATPLSWISGVEFNLAPKAIMKYKMASGAYKMECKKPGTCGHTMLGTQKYDLLQVHSHQHSEHSLNGKLYPTEIHNVHIFNGTQLLVIGVFFDEGPKNPEFQKFIDNAKNLTVGWELNMQALVGPAIQPQFLTMYQGSLTTPPCSEGVRWAVSSKVLSVSKEQIAELKTLAANRLDARPVQPMNGRPFLKL